MGGDFSLNKLSLGKESAFLNTRSENGNTKENLADKVNYSFFDRLKVRKKIFCFGFYFCFNCVF